MYLSEVMQMRFQGCGGVVDLRQLVVVMPLVVVITMPPPMIMLAPMAVVVILVVPMSFVPFPAFAIVVVVRMGPVCPFIRRTLPVSADPLVMVTHRSPISFDPNEADVGRRPRLFINDRWGEFHSSPAINCLKDEIHWPPTSCAKKYGALNSGRHLSSVLGLADSLAFVANHFQVGHANVASFNRTLLLMLLSLTLF